MLAVLVLAAGVGFGIWLVTRGLPRWQTPVRVILEDASVLALTQSGRLVWAWPLGRVSHSPASLAPKNRFAVGDLDGDGRDEFAVPVSWAALRDVSQVSDETLVFDARGRLTRVIKPDVRVRDQGRTWEGPWRVSAVAIATAPPARLWIAFNHHTSGPTFVLEVDSRGTRRIRYLQAGVIRALTHWQHGGRDLLAIGGVEQRLQTAAVAVLDLDAAPARWPGRHTSAWSCAHCPTGTPLAVLTIPTSHVTHDRLRSSSMVAAMAVTPAGSLSIDVSSGGSSMALETQAVLTPDLVLTRSERSNDHWAAHRVLEAEGILDHGVDACPEADAIDVQLWTRGEWTQHRIATARQDALPRVAGDLSATGKAQLR
ncbi:MAG TPA: hypothetical protein VMF13_12960 [Luteitalea sp.]|nr:hypothetical protein [Luteitalea sp.]